MTRFGALKACATGEPKGTFEGRKARCTKGHQSSPTQWQAKGRASGASRVELQGCDAGQLAARFQSPDMVARWCTLGVRTCAIGGPLGTHFLNYVAAIRSLFERPLWRLLATCLFAIGRPRDGDPLTSQPRPDQHPGPPRSGFVLCPRVGLYWRPHLSRPAKIRLVYTTRSMAANSTITVRKNLNTTLGVHCIGKRTPREEREIVRNGLDERAEVGCRGHCELSFRGGEHLVL